MDRWIALFKADGIISKDRERSKKIKQNHEEYIVALVCNYPLLTLVQMKEKFHNNFDFHISVASIWRILSKHNFSYKVLERRSIEIKMAKITFFTDEINNLSPIPEQLLFLDEMAVDNRSMLKKRGFFRKGEAQYILGNLGEEKGFPFWHLLM